MTEENNDEKRPKPALKCFIVLQAVKAEDQSGSDVGLYFFRTVDLSTTPSYDVILPGLYLGNERTANLHLIRRLAITHILTVQEMPLSPCLIAEANVTTMFIDAPDAVETNLKKYFPLSNAFIDEGIRHGAVLVHCHYGVSRSATLVTAYLMYKYSMSLDAALSMVRNKRSFVNPNPGFMQQLQEYEASRYQINCFLALRGYFSMIFNNHKGKIFTSLAVCLGITAVPLYLYLKKPDLYYLYIDYLKLHVPQKINLLRN